MKKLFVVSYIYHILGGGAVIPCSQFRWDNPPCGMIHRENIDSLVELVFQDSVSANAKFLALKRQQKTFGTLSVIIVNDTTDLYNLRIEERISKKK